MPTSIDVQPRIDTLVTSVSGAPGRRTEYAGLAWYGDKPDVGATLMVAANSRADLDEPFFLPDSLPYRAADAASALVRCTAALQAAMDETHLLTEARAALDADPRDPAVCWIQVSFRGRVRTPSGIAYRVDVIVPPDAVQDTPAG